MLLRDALTSAVGRLTSAGVGSPRMNAEVLLMFTMGIDRAYMYAHPERELSAEECMRYEQALAERSRGVPAQYITGHQEFWGMDFVVSPAVLIPRPETEHVIEKVLALVKRENDSGRQTANSVPTAVSTVKGGIRVVDVGTGSGCIAIVLANELPDTNIYATDISSAALDLARANAERHQLGSRIQFRQADLLDGLPSQSFDLVVSNPPYVGESEGDQVQLEVRKFEPRNAVFAGHTGLEVIQRLVPAAGATLKPGGWLVMEISGTIMAGVEGLLAGWSQVEIMNDLQGIPRVVTAKKPSARNLSARKPS